MGRGKIGYKSKELKARQRGNPAQVLSYAARTNERLRRQSSRLIQRCVKRPVAVTAVAREWACFVWGMQIERLGLRGGRHEGVFPQQRHAGGQGFEEQGEAAA